MFEWFTLGFHKTEVIIGGDSSRLPLVVKQFMKWMGAQVLAPIRHLLWHALLIANYRKGPTSLCVRWITLNSKAYLKKAGEE